MALPVVRNLCGVNGVWTSETSHPVRAENLAQSQTPHSSTITVTHPAIESRYSLGGVFWSYSDKPPNGSNVTVTLNPGGLVYKMYVSDGGPGFSLFDPPLTTSRNTSITISLSSGGGKESSLAVNLWTYDTDPYEWV